VGKQRVTIADSDIKLPNLSRKHSRVEYVNLIVEYVNLLAFQQLVYE